MSSNVNSQTPALRVIQQQLERATAAPKCHRCGCFSATIEALRSSSVARQLGPTLEPAQAVIATKEYDCLGCPVCFPAIAANAFTQAFPDQGESLDLCPTGAPIERRGWPPLPGDYHVVRYRAPVAVCTLNSEALAGQLAMNASGVAIAGTLHTENLGIEHLIRNTLANPHIRFLVLCGEDTRQAIGHLPGQSLASLFESGVDARRRIQGALGKRPVLENVTSEQIQAFLQQVELVNRIGVQDDQALADCIEACQRRDPGPFESHLRESDLATIQANEPRQLIPDRAGFLVIYPDARRTLLVVEHYDNDGVLDAIIEGRTPAAVCSTLIERELLSRLDHAAYLGRELARAERSLQTGEPYVQDRAPGRLQEEDATAVDCGCPPSASCGRTT